MKTLRLAEFCAGTGAFSLSFKETKKVKTIFSNDIEINAKKIYDANFTTKMTLLDIHELKNTDIPKMDILTAGFPCQPFSLAGNKQGFKDFRSNVFFKLIDIIKYKKPECIVLENVKNLLSHNNKETFKVITDNIIKLGYTFKYSILNTCKITNIPQNRERLYIVCFKNSKNTELFQFPNQNIDTIQLKDFLLENVDDKYYYKEKLKVYDTIVKNVLKNISENVLYQYRRHYVRENKNNVCPTLTANGGSGGHNIPLLKDLKGIRKLSPRECFKLQGFPETYILPKELSDSALYKLAGNAVTVPITSLIAENIIKILNKTEN